MIKLNLEDCNFYVAIDFDKTITSSKSADSWAASANPKIVGEEIYKEMAKLYTKYRPIEMNYKISQEEKSKAMIEWYSSCMELYHKYNLSKRDITESIEKSRIIFRKGAKDFLLLMQKYNIPVIILSAGIGNCIEQFLKNNNCLLENMYIISNFLEYDENNKVKKFDNSKIIHTLNKNMNGHLPKKFEEKIQGKKYRLLIGDLIEDLKMVNESELENTVKIGIINQGMEESIVIYKEKFDIVLVNKEATFDKITSLVF